MSETLESGRVPRWTLGDRLRKARSLTGLNTRDFAHEIGVSQNTVTSAEAGKRSVRSITIKAYAMRTGVPVEWLETGVIPDEPNGPESVRHDGLEPPTHCFRGFDAVQHGLNRQHRAKVVSLFRPMPVQIMVDDEKVAS